MASSAWARVGTIDQSKACANPVGCRGLAGYSKIAFRRNSSLKQLRRHVRREGTRLRSSAA